VVLRVADQFNSDQLHRKGFSNTPRDSGNFWELYPGNVDTDIPRSIYTVETATWIPWETPNQK
jgi:hypothetical protein